MTSFNQYALGAIADWLHRCIAGLAPAAPGYMEIVVRPSPSPELTSACAHHLTPYCEARVAWELDGNRFHFTVHIPVGSTARIYLPTANTPEVVDPGDHHWKTTIPA